MPKSKADCNNNDNIVFQEIKNSIEENEESDDTFSDHTYPFLALLPLV